MILDSQGPASRSSEGCMIIFEFVFSWRSCMYSYVCISWFPNLPYLHYLCTHGLIQPQACLFIHPSIHSWIPTTSRPPTPPPASPSPPPRATSPRSPPSRPRAATSSPRPRGRRSTPPSRRTGGSPRGSATGCGGGRQS